MTRRVIISSLLTLFIAGCASRPDCNPISGFELGRSGQAAPSACSALDYGEAWRLGQNLGALESELQNLQRLSAPNVAEQQRMRVLQREIPELETLARLNNLLPQQTDLESFGNQNP